MDPNRFDSFAKQLAGSRTRRGVLRALAGAGAAGLLSGRRTAAKDPCPPTDCRPPQVLDPDSCTCVCPDCPPGKVLANPVTCKCGCPPEQLCPGPGGGPAACCDPCAQCDKATGTCVSNCGLCQTCDPVSGECVPLPCPPCQVCDRRGVCVDTCPAGALCLDGQCCQGAGGTCAGSAECCGELSCRGAGGGAVCACQDGRTACGSRCLDTATDRGNCGACGHACPAGATCVAGRCCLEEGSACVDGPGCCAGLSCFSESDGTTTCQGIGGNAVGGDECARLGSSCKFVSCCAELSCIRSLDGSPICA